MDFWERVARGHIRLSPFEDRLVWRMRGAGETWGAIESRINAIRQNRALADASDKSLQEMTSLPHEVGSIDRSEAIFWRNRLNGGLASE